MAHIAAQITAWAFLWLLAAQSVVSSPWWPMFPYHPPTSSWVPGVRNPDLIRLHHRVAPPIAPASQYPSFWGSFGPPVPAFILVLLAPSVVVEKNATGQAGIDEILQGVSSSEPSFSFDPTSPTSQQDTNTSVVDQYPKAVFPPLLPGVVTQPPTAPPPGVWPPVNIPGVPLDPITGAAIWPPPLPGVTTSSPATGTPPSIWQIQPLKTTTQSSVPPAFSSSSSCGVRGTFGRSEDENVPWTRNESDEDTSGQSFNSDEVEDLKVGQIIRDVSTAPAVDTDEVELPDVSESLFFKAIEPDSVNLDSILSTRITFGQETRRGEFPWQVAMTTRGKFHCGASLISNSHVLTAAHCVVKYVSNPLAINLAIGDYDLRSSTDGVHVDAAIAQIFVHPQYSPSTLQNDVAVLKLSQNVQFTKYLSPVCLASSDAGLVGRTSTVTGWGRDERRKLASRMQKLTAAIIDNKVCSQMWSAKSGKKSLITPNMICKSAQNGDSCSGDSGGPSVVETSPGVFMQVGIVSFGSGSCTDPDLPGVYTKVSAYLGWIRSQMT